MKNGYHMHFFECTASRCSQASLPALIWNALHVDLVCTSDVYPWRHSGLIDSTSLTQHHGDCHIGSNLHISRLKYLPIVTGSMCFDDRLPRLFPHDHWHDAHLAVAVAAMAAGKLAHSVRHIEGHHLRFHHGHHHRSVFNPIPFHRSISS